MEGFRNQLWKSALAKTSSPTKRIHKYHKKVPHSTPKDFILEWGRVKEAHFPTFYGGWKCCLTLKEGMSPSPTELVMDGCRSSGGWDHIVFCKHKFALVLIYLK